MRKYICNACGIRICTAEYQSGSGIPMKCTALIDKYCKAAWHEVKEETCTPTCTPTCTKLPDWCKVGETVWYKDFNLYCVVERIQKHGTDLRKVADGSLIVTGTEFLTMDCVEARKRPFNADEMKALVGKVYESSCCTFLVTGYDKRKKTIKVNELWFDSEELMNGKNSIYPPLIDGKPCYKLEHLENGEWVE